MEHEFEKTIREKVRNAEMNSVNWEREMVWSKINLSSGHPFIFYYVAASILLATALIFFTIELNNRKQIDLQLSSIELSIEKNKVSQIELLFKTKSASESVACDESNTVARPQRSLLASGKNKQKVSDQIISAREVVNSETEKQDEIIKAEEPTISFHETVNPVEIKTHQVQAIIGSHYSDVLPTDKKLKFKLFNSEEDNQKSKTTSELITLHSKIK